MRHNKLALCYVAILKLFEGDSCSLGHIKSTLLVQGADSVSYKTPEASLLIHLYGAASDNDLLVVG